MDEASSLRLEAIEFIETAERHVRATDGTPEQPLDFDAIDRALHSVRSLAVLMGMTQMRDRLHGMATAFASMRKKGRVTEDDANYLRRGLAVARASLVALPTPNARSRTTGFGDRALVLVLGDEVEFGKPLARYLDREGYDALATDDLEAAPSLLKTHSPVAVLYDQDRPGMGALREKLRSANPGLTVVAVPGEDLRESGQFVDGTAGRVRLIDACRAASRLDGVTRLLNEACDLLKFQFSDLSEYLRQTGREDLCDYFARQIQDLLRRRQAFRAIGS